MWDLNMAWQRVNGTVWKGRPKRVKVLYVKIQSRLEVSQVPRDTGNPVGIKADHGLRLKTIPKPIVKVSRLVKLIRTPGGE